MHKNNSQKGSIFVILSGLLYGLVGYFGITIIEDNFTICTMLFWRFLISSIFLSLIIVLNKESYKYFSSQNFKLLIYGAIFYSTNTVFYFLSSKYIGTGLAMVIFFIYPLLIIAFNWLYNKIAISRIYYISISLLLIGVILLIKKDEIKLDLLGIVLAAASAVEYAIYMIYSKHISNDIPPILSGLLVSIGGCIGCLTFSLIDGAFHVPSNLITWFNIISMGIVCTALPILFLLKSLKHISTDKAAILSVLEPIFVVISGTLLLGENISFSQLLGIIIILIGTFLTQINSFR